MHRIQHFPLLCSRYSCPPSYLSIRCRTLITGAKQSKKLPPHLDDLTGHESASKLPKFKDSTSRLKFQNEAEARKRELSLKLLDAQPAVSSSILDALDKDPSNAGEILQRCIENYTINLAVIKACLHRARAHFARQPPADIVPAARQQRVPLGRTTLQYLWEDSARWIPIATQEHDTLNDLCWIASAEGLDAIIQSWLEVDIPMTDKSLDPERPHAWRGSVLGSLVKAHIDRNSFSATTALQCFFDVVARKRIIKASHIARLDAGEVTTPPGIWFLSVRPAVIKLIQSLTRQRWIETDPVLYDDFVAFSRHYTAKLGEFGAGMDEAHLLLHHPTCPNHVKTVRAYKPFFEKNSHAAREFLSAASPAYRTKMAARLNTARDLAQCGGHSQDVAWLSSTIQEHFSGLRRRKDSGREHIPRSSTGRSGGTSIK